MGDLVNLLCGKPGRLYLESYLFLFVILLLVFCLGWTSRDMF